MNKNVTGWKKWGLEGRSCGLAYFGVLVKREKASVLINLF